MVRALAPAAVLAAALVGTAASTAAADTLFVNLTGFQSWGFYGTAANTSITLNLDAGTQITAIDFVDFTFTAEGNSFENEFVVSVNDSPAAIGFWDSTVPGALNAPGTFGPISAAFNNPGQFGSGPFTMTTNTLYIEVYDTFDDGGVGTRDAIVNTGGIQITYTPVPGPGALTALALGCALSGRRRRRA